MISIVAAIVIVIVIAMVTIYTIFTIVTILLIIPTRSMAESEAYSLRAAVSRGKLTTEH